jgi:hypothetical protein
MTLPRTVLAEQIALGRAGRLAPPKNWTPASGTAALVLGSDIPGVFVKADVGDAIEAKTFGDFTNGGTTAYVRFTMHVRPPASAMPVGVYWKMTATLVDGANAGSPTPPRCELDLRDANNREASHYDFALPVLGTSSIVSGSLQPDSRFRSGARRDRRETTRSSCRASTSTAVIMDSAGRRVRRPINRVPDNGDVKVPIDTRASSWRSTTRTRRAETSSAGASQAPRRST